VTGRGFRGGRVKPAARGKRRKNLAGKRPRRKSPIEGFERPEEKEGAGLVLWSCDRKEGDFTMGGEMSSEGRRRKKGKRRKQIRKYFGGGKRTGAKKCQKKENNKN